LIPLKLRKRNGINSFSEQHICYFEGLNAKTEIPDLLVNARTGKVCFFDYMEERKHDPLNGIFIRNEQIGIRIPKNEAERDKNEKGFYRQVGYTMPQGFGFAFYAEIEKGNNTFKSGLVRMGADQSWFRIDITGETDKHAYIGDFSSLTANLFRKVNDFNEKVVLLSDCYMEEPEYDKRCSFASVSTVLFRYLKIDANGTYSLKGAGFKLKKSDEYRTLLKKGSVLFVNSKEEKIELINYLQQNLAFFNIGYNHAI
jgi:CRISPR type III-B/RAMP module-associated protein Cmr3